MLKLKNQKRVEHSNAFQASLKLGEEWHLEEREAPDFLVTTATGMFGLEVTDCHIGARTRGGSKARAAESANARWLKNVREEYERQGGVGLHLRYFGEASEAARLRLLAALGSTVFEDTYDSPPREFSILGGRAWASKAPHTVWTMVSDRVGWVSHDGAYLQREIDAKAEKLTKYREICSDIRLLVVADRIHNSGKLELDDDFIPNLRGFDAVYFFSYPISVTAFYRVGLYQRN